MSGNYLYHRGSKAGEARGNYIYDNHSNKVGEIRGDYIYDGHSNKVGEIRDDYIYDGHSNRIGSISDVKKAIDGAVGRAIVIAFWICLVR